MRVVYRVALSSLASPKAMHAGKLEGLLSKEDSPFEILRLPGVETYAVVEGVVGGERVHLREVAAQQLYGVGRGAYVVGVQVDIGASRSVMAEVNVAMYGVVATTAPGVAAQDTTHCEIESLERPVMLER